MAWWWQGGHFHVVILAMVSGFGGGGNRHGLIVGFSSIFCFGIVVICWAEDLGPCSSDLGSCCG